MSSQSLIAQLQARIIILEQDNDSLAGRCERLHTELAQIQRENDSLTARCEFLTQQVEVAKHSAIAQEQAQTAINPGVYPRGHINPA